MAITKIKKAQKKKIVAEEKQRKEKLYTFLKDYGNPEDPQTLDASATDRQIQSIMTYLSDQISSMKKGTVVDIGCGKGTLLARLAELPAFKENESVIYLGTDFPEMSKEVFKCAIERGVHRRVDWTGLDTFYTDWPDRNKFPEPHIVVIRNVIHELGINITARLIWHMANGMKPREVAIIQDMAVFPKAEKGHACWLPEQFRTLISDCGFEVSLIPERSSSGNQWFNLLLNRNEEIPLTIELITEKVLKARLTQIDQWKGMGALLPDDELFRDVQIAKIDFDLQFAALVLQIQDVGHKIQELSELQQALVHRSIFKKHLYDFNVIVPKSTRLAFAVSRHFRDRAHSLNALVEFFTSDYSVTVISGPPLMGKSELVRHFLCSEDFQQERLPVFVDLITTSGVWNLLDQILSEMGCAVPNEVLRGMSKLKLDDIVDELFNFFQKNAPKLVVVIDHLERITDPSGAIADPDIRKLLVILGDQKSAKLILTSRRANTDLTFFRSGILYLDPQPVVGRFPRSDNVHVENVLHSFLLQSEYPRELLEAIDHHPFLATLAGMYLRQRGEEALKDKDLIEDLRLNLRNAIFSKIITSNARPAVEAISRLRIPVPRDMIVALSSEYSLKTAEEAGLIRPHLGGKRGDLLGCIGALRIVVWELSGEGDVIGAEDANITTTMTERQFHKKIANAYEGIYRTSDDPIWLREAYFHRIICSSEEQLTMFGIRYCAELFAAGEYWYDKEKDFHKAHWAYMRAFKYGQTGYVIHMRIASCKLRIASNTKQEEEARQEFEALIKHYPGEYGIKTAYIDAILYKKNYKIAIQMLQKLGLNEIDNWWVAGQYGRAYSGLHEYKKAISAFELQLQEKPEPFVYEQISRAYHHLGDDVNELRTVTHGLNKYPENKRLRVYKGALLERTGNVPDAFEILDKLMREDPDNAWVFFPYIKAMDRLGKLREAEQYWKEHQYRFRPEFLKISIESDLLVRRGQFADAITKLRSLPDDEHKIGQLLEAYLS